ncbi:MAG: DoxX family protein, partial [Micropruina sp.]
PPKPVVVTKRTTDRFVGGLGLFLLRLVVAAILAVRGLEMVMNIPAAQEMFAQTRIPQPEIMAIVTGISALAIALSLIFGLLVRVAGLGVVLIAGGALAFVQWGNWSPFVAGRPGFLGEFELLLAAVGLLLVCVGGGGFGLDRSFRLSRERSKAAKEPVSA